MTGKRIAIVYDWLDKWGGVERVLLTFHEMFPSAHWYTSYFDKKSAAWAKDFDIKTSFIQKLPGFIKGNRILSLPVYPYAFESMDFSDYDVVISITSSFAKSIITKPGTKHICYLLTPTRWLWSQQEIYTKKWIPAFAGMTLPFLTKLREWDYIAAQRPDQIISISNHVSKRCNKYYKRETEVIYPPFDVDYWGKIKSQIINTKIQTNSKLQIQKKYYLVVSRLESYKRVDLAIEYFNGREEQLVVVGTGSQKSKLKNMAGKNITFLENLSDHELAHFYTHAQALIMPQEEDFGYVALEAQFFGCPVISYSQSGAAEIVEDGITGILFNKQEKTALSDAIARLSVVAYNLKGNLSKNRNQFEIYSKKVFQNKIKDLILKI